jgi:hypothetical protein
VATVLMPTDECINELEVLISSFVVGQLNISAERVFKSVEEGGLGLFALKDFIISLQSVWFKRILATNFDNWANKIRTLSYNEPVYIQEKDMDNCGTLIGGLIKSFITFRQHYGKINNNFMHVPILNNENFRITQREADIFDDNFFESFLPGYNRELIKKLTWKQITNNYDLLNRFDLVERLGIIPSVRVYARLKSGLQLACKNFKKQNKLGLSIEDFLNSFKKGSKKIRKVIYLSKNPVTVFKTRQIRTMSKITGTGIPPDCTAKIINTAWNANFLNMDVRIFIFKYFNNTLGLGARVNHINSDIDASCTFCRICKILPAQRENFDHFFWYCSTTAKLIEYFTANFLTLELTKETYFNYGGIIPDEQYSFIIFLCIFRYVLWSYKLKKRLPYWLSFKDAFMYNLSIAFNTSKKFKNKLTNCSFYRDVRRR